MRAYICESKTRGTWKLRYWEKGIRKEKQLGTRRDWPNRAAAEKANAHVLAIYNGEVKVVPTLQQVIERYRTDAMPDRKSTRRGYETWIKNYILPRWGNLLLTELKPDPVEMWLKDLSLATKTKRNIKGILAILWNFAMKKELIEFGPNPMALVTIKKRRGEKRKLPVKDLSKEQFQALLKAVESNTELHTMVIVTLSLGLRISEARGLQWGDINWLEKTVTVERGVVKQDVDDVKTEESARTMFLADDVVAVLERWRKVSQFTEPTHWVFASPWKLGKQPVSYSWVWYGLSEAGKVAGIGHISSHAFRNVFRTWLDSIGTPVGVQQKMMRHADIRTTMNHYGKAHMETLRKAAEKIGNLATLQPYRVAS